ncbi:MAG: DUF296 domain-containing protein [Coriobacteriales bacterium]|nr:DUF296 domain-containing protein [Coriobacteriales bacterium]
MDYRVFGDTCYIRMDKGDEIISSLLGVCEREGIRSATFMGIGGCGSAQIQVFDPDAGTFSTQSYEGVLELVSLMGNVVDGAQDGIFWHAHALFSFRDGDDHRMAAGHLKEATVLYTAEIELRPVAGGVIGSAPDPVTGTRFWAF